MYDCVVLGVGGIGSGAMLAAAQRGWKVLGLEQFGSAHDKGSSHGRTRIIRTAYFEHPNYVPLAREAWDRWDAMQADSNVKLIQKTGLLQVGDADGEVVQGVLRSAKEHAIPIHQWTAKETMERFPVLNLPDDAACVYEEQAGFLLIENCVAQQIKMATELGAEFRANAKVTGLTICDDESVRIHLGDETVESKRLIVCVGPWAPTFFDSLPIDLRVIRKQQQWFQLDRIDIKYENGFPAFLIETDEKCFYGFPEIDYLGMKVAEHSGGQAASSPDTIDRECNLDDLRATESFMDSYFHFKRRRMVHQSTCMYTMSSDGDFIIDHHPDSRHVVFAAGMSGHGFKFAPLIGERLVGLLIGEPDDQWNFLRMEGRSLQADN